MAFSVVHACLDLGTSFSRAAYALLTDGSTQSQIRYTKDFFETTPVWETRATIDGVFAQIESTRGKPNEIYISGTTTTPGPCTTGWFARFGTEIARTATTIDIASLPRPVSGHAYVEVAAPDIDTCVMLSNEIIDGSFSGAACFIPCGLPISGGNEDCSWLGPACANFGALDDAGPGFTVRFHLEPSDECGDCGDVVGAQSRRSTDGGATFEAAQSYGSIETLPGFDVGRSGLAALAGNSEEVVISTGGGSYSTDGRGPDLTDSYPASIVIPDLRPGNSSLTNISAMPGYMVASASPVSGDTVWVVITTNAPKTPKVSGFPGAGVGPLGLDAWRGKRYMLVGDVTDATPTTTRYLFITKSTGAAWSHVAKTNAIAVRAQRFSTTGNEWILSRRSDGCEYSKDCGATWTSVSGDQTDYAEIFG